MNNKARTAKISNAVIDLFTIPFALQISAVPEEALGIFGTWL